MGHASSIALGVALNCQDKRVWCIDGDGAVLIHMGIQPVIANCRPHNLIHIVIDNGAHETVGGQSTVMKDLGLIEVKCRLGSRKDLGRPTTSTGENKERFSEY